MTDLFAPYPASSASVRTAARSGQASAGAIAAVETSVAVRHRATLDEAEGDLRGWLAGEDSTLLEQSRTDFGALQRSAVWAAAQLERFADAIDDYNVNSTEPRSISKLNAARRDATGTANLGLVVEGLKQEKTALDTELDECAARIAESLDREPTADELRNAWLAGNLSSRAVNLWPDAGLKLSDLPYGMRDAGVYVNDLDSLTDQQLADALKDVDLNPTIRQAILSDHPEAVALLSEQWEFNGDTRALPGNVCNEGWIVGPDGQLYNVEIPGPGEEHDGPIVTAGTDFIPDDNNGPTQPGLAGWGTVDSREGSLEFGEEPPFGAAVLAGAIGGIKSYGWQSAGGDQQAYVVMNNGHVYLADELPEGSDYNRPPSVAETTKDSTTGKDTGQVASPGAEGVDNVVRALEGAVIEVQAEDGRHYATDVTFQLDPTTGERRAVINIYQVETNGEEIRISHMNGIVDGHGNVVPAVVGEDGIPVPADR